MYKTIVLTLSSIERSRLFFLYCFAFFSLISNTFAELFLLLFCLLCVVDSKFWQGIKNDNVFIFSSFFLIYIFFRFGFDLYCNSFFSKEVINDCLSFFRSFLFFCVGYVIAFDLKRFKFVVVLMFIGMIIGVVVNPDILKLPEIWNGRRTGFHIKITSFALYCDVAVLALICFSSDVISFFDYNVLNNMKYIFLIVSVLIFGQLLIFTRSRSSWLALIVVLPFIFLSKLSSSPPFNFKKKNVVVLCGVVFSAVIVWIGFNASNIQGRVYEEFKSIYSVYKNIINADFQPHLSPSASIDYRYNLFLFGVQKISEKPLFGWGATSTKELVRKSGVTFLMHSDFKGGIDWLDHLHNTYLEIMVRFGVVGLIPFVGMLWVLMFRLLIIFKIKEVREYVFFSAASLAVILIWSFFDFRLLHPHIRYFWILILGGTWAVGKLSENSEDNIGGCFGQKV